MIRRSCIFAATKTCELPAIPWSGCEPLNVPRQAAKRQCIKIRRFFTEKHGHPGCPNYLRSNFVPIGILEKASFKNRSTPACLYVFFQIRIVFKKKSPNSCQTPTKAILHHQPNSIYDEGILSLTSFARL